MEAEIKMKCHPQVSVPNKTLHTFRHVLGTAQMRQAVVWSVGPEHMRNEGTFKQNKCGFSVGRITKMGIG